MERRSALDNAGLPSVLHKSTPRPVRANASGGLMYFAAAALVAGGIWGGITLNEQAQAARAAWPAAVVPFGCVAAAVVLIAVVRREANLLAYGRATMGTVTRIEKKRTDKGTLWIVHYDFKTMSGATRSGKYNHGKKNLPAIGSAVPVVYDRDDTSRHAKFPMTFVAIRQA